MQLRFRHELRKLINAHGVDTYLDAPDWLIETTITEYLETIKSFAARTKNAPQNTMEVANLQHTKGSPKCEQCEYFDLSQKVYTLECFSCKHYYGDMFTRRASD